MRLDQPYFSPVDWASAQRTRNAEEGSVIWGTVELDRRGIPDLFILVCFGRVLLLGKMCLPRTFHLDSD